MDELTELEEQEASENERAELELEKIRGELAAKLAGGTMESTRCSINRLDPDWSRGYMCTIPADDTFTIERIKANCGGGYYLLEFRDENGKYLLKRRVSIEGPPMRNGVMLDDPQTAALKAEREREREYQRQSNSGNQNNMLDTVVALMGTQQQQMTTVMQDSFNQNLALLTATMQNAQRAQPDPISQMGVYFELFQKMQGPQAQSGDADLTSILEKFADVLGDRKKKEDSQPPFIGAQYLPQPPAQAAQAAAPVPVPQAPPAAAPAHVAVQQAAITPDADTIADTLAGLDPDQAAAVMFNAFEKAPPENKIKLMQIFTGGDSMEDLDDDDQTLEGASDDDYESSGGQ